jgi:hypothetical protein
VAIERGGVEADDLNQSWNVGNVVVGDRFDPDYRHGVYCHLADRQQGLFLPAATGLAL